MKLISYCLIFLSLLNIGQLNAQTRGYTRISINASAESVNDWQRQGIMPAHFHYKKGLLVMELDSTELSAFDKRGIFYQDITDSFNKQAIAAKGDSGKSRAAPTNFTYGSMAGYHTYDETMAVLDDMRARFPDLVSEKDTLGLTYEGLPIVAISIGDNPGMIEDGEDEWLMTGLHHSNEVMGQEVVLYFAWYLLENYQTDKEIRNLLNNSTLYLVPVVNPDGHVYNESVAPAGGGTWRKNRKPRVISGTTHYGIDLNRNYGYRWAYAHAGQLGQAGSSFAGNNYYRGTAAWSEAETQALRNLCSAHFFTAAFNYHAWDDSFNYPWNFDVDFLTPDHIKFNAIAQYCTQETQFETGTFNQTLGYSANGTSDDWMYGEQTTKNKIFAFTIEVGKQFWPAQSLIPVYCDSLLHANIKMLRMAAKYAAIEETSRDTVRALSSYLSYNLKRYSIKDTNFTVSVTPLDSYVTFTGPAKTYTDLSFLETRDDTIVFQLSPGTPQDTVLRFLLTVDNGKWTTTDTIFKVFHAHTTLPLGCTDTNEPNNSIAQAIHIVPGQLKIASIEKSGDEDWFYFENTAENSNIRLVLSDLRADYDIELLTASGQKVAASSRPGHMNDTIVYNTGTIGSFRVRVYGYKAAYHPLACYILDLKLGDRPFEPTANTITKEPGNEELSFSAYPLPAANQLNVSVKAKKAQKLYWFITDNTGRQLNSGNRNVSKGSSLFSIPLNGLLPGFYVLNIVTGITGQRISLKIVKE